MARLCLACQATAPNHFEYCPACGRNFAETQRAWSGDLAAWRRFLEQTGWYPGRRDEWAELRWQSPPEPITRPRPPRRLVVRYLGGHPELSRLGRVVLTRDDGAVAVAVPGWWPPRTPKVAIPLRAVRSVTGQRTTESSLDDAVMTAAIGGARTGPLGVALGTAIGRRRRVLRTVHVRVDLAGEAVEIVFRPLEEHGASGVSALIRIFQASD
jgi:hypothetical protein